MRRIRYLDKIDDRLKTFKAVALLGPRQSGKTTLARQKCELLKNFDWQLNYFDLEDPTAIARLTDPKLALQDLRGLVVIDEIQRRPELFPTLRYLLDRKENEMQLLILGSASKDLIRQSSESLAGRIAYLEVTPFSLAELESTSDQKKLWLRGGFPLAFLADEDRQCFIWLDEYIRSYLERDIPQLGITIPAETMRRFWTMLTHNHANILNSSELGRSFDVSDTTIKRYLDILTATFMIRQLNPYHANIKKRQVKAPKIYFRDSGILHKLMGIQDFGSLHNHIKLGASWEGFALEQTIARKAISSENCMFWAVHEQAEIDLIIENQGNLTGYEFKYTDKPSITKSIKMALEILDLSKITIITPNKEQYQLADKVFVTGLS